MVNLRPVCVEIGTKVTINRVSGASMMIGWGEIADGKEAEIAE